MVFVTTGSQKFQFNRLLNAVDNLIANRTIQDEVIAQSGYCTYLPNNYLAIDFMSHDKFEDILFKSDIVITHGGTGIIIKALKLRKKIIAVPRLSEYGEHVDDHQIQLIEAFGQANYLESCLDIDDLGQKYLLCKSKTYSLFTSNNEIFLADLDMRLSDNKFNANDYQ